MIARARGLTRLRSVLATVVLLLAAASVSAQMPKYRVKVTIDKSTDFSRLTSYSWEPGWLSSDPRVGQQVISAVEQELAARGLTKGPEGQSDVTVAYATLQRTDVNFKAKRTPAGVHPSYPVGSLVIVMRNPRTQKELFRGRADTPIDLEIEKLKGTINDQVAQIFAKYPKRHGSRG